MEDPDVITRAQLPLAFREWQNCCTGKRAKRHDHERGGNIRIYLYGGSYEQLHIPTRGARYYTEISGPSPTWKNMQKTCSIIIIGIIPLGYYQLHTDFLYV